MLLCIVVKNKESALLEFKSIRNTIQCTKFTPLQFQLVKVWICDEFLDTRLSKNSNFEIPEYVSTKPRVPRKICNYGNFG